MLCSTYSLVTAYMYILLIKDNSLWADSTTPLFCIFSNANIISVLFISFIATVPSQFVIFFIILSFWVIVASLVLLFLSSNHSSITFCNVNDSEAFLILLIDIGLLFLDNCSLASSLFCLASFNPTSG